MLSFDIFNFMRDVRRATQTHRRCTDYSHLFIDTADFITNSTYRCARPVPVITFKIVTLDLTEVL